MYMVRDSRQVGLSFEMDKHSDVGVVSRLTSENSRCISNTIQQSDSVSGIPSCAQ